MQGKVIDDRYGSGDLGIELPTRTRHSLRLAIAAIVFVYANASAPVIADASLGDYDFLRDGVVVHGEPWDGIVWGTPYEEPWTPSLPNPIDQDEGDGYDSGGGSGSSDAAGNQKDAEKRVPCDNPVDLGTGKKFETETDFYSRSNNGLRMIRSYNQSWPGRGVMGIKWITLFDQKLSFDTAWGFDGVGCYPVPGSPACNVPIAAEIYVHAFDGNVTRFIADSPGVWKGSEEAPLARLVRLSGGSFELTWSDGRIAVYRPSGEIVQMLAADATGLAFTYDASGFPVQMAHTSGRTIVAGKTGSLLTSVADPAGQVYAYAYTGGVLSSVQRPDGKGNLLFHYEQALGNLTGISIAGQRYTYYTYDASERVIKTRKANGADEKNYAYFADRVERTNSLGRKTTYNISNGQVTGITGSATVNCPAYFTATSTDAEGRANIEIDARNMATDLDFDTNGRIYKVTTAVGEPHERVETFEWDPVSGDMTKHTLLGVRETTYQFDLYHRPSITSVRNLGAGVPNQTRTVAMSYTNHANGMTSAVTRDGPRPGSGDTTVFTYNSLGDMTSVTNERGHVTTFSNHNALGQARRVTDPNGQVFEREYDVAGRLISSGPVIAGTLRATTMHHDSFGRLDWFTDASGRTTRHYFDSIGRLTKVELQENEAVKQQTVYSYDANSQPTEVRRQRITQ